MLAGVASMFGCVGVALSGQDIAHFWTALVLLGIGWNFMYIGGTTLLTEAYRPSEKAKAQGVNEITIFAVQAISALLLGRAGEHRGLATRSTTWRCRSIAVAGFAGALAGGADFDVRKWRAASALRRG